MSRTWQRLTPIAASLFVLGVITFALLPAHPATKSLANSYSSVTSGTSRSRLSSLWGGNKITSMRTDNFTWELPLYYEDREKIVDGLNPNNRYLVSWPFAGFTNQVMSTINLIYLAKLSGKIPIVSPLSAHTAHLHDNAASEMHPSRIFDFDGLFAELDMPWVDLDALRPRIKAPTVVLGSPADQPPSREKEILPTWGLLETTFYRCGMGYGAEIWGSREIEQVKTPLPYELFSANSENQAGVFERLARFLRNPAIAASWANPPAPRVQVQLDHYSEVHPDFKCEAPSITPNPWTDALTTIDGMYWLISEEMGPDYPMRDVQDQFRHGHANWQQVGKHMRFLPQWEEAARAAERKLLGLTEDEEVPKFHALHIRRGDKIPQDCSDREAAKTRRECRPLTMFIEKLQGCLEVARKAGKIGYDERERILVMSDDDSAEFRAEVAEQGYIFVDHEKLGTAREYGHDGSWASTIIDSIIMTHGQCFIGTFSSTMSEVNARRGKEWYDHDFDYLW